ncbi:hypothetical protein Ddc_23095 [Ditylenchus destructor]|nr:hypothetical protein Ddc_23095 [Ditylenchus destructor]
MWNATASAPIDTAAFAPALGTHKTGRSNTTSIDHQHRHPHARAASVHARRRVSLVRPPARPARGGHRPTPPTPP